MFDSLFAPDGLGGLGLTDQSKQKNECEPRDHLLPLLIKKTVSMGFQHRFNRSGRVFCLSYFNLLVASLLVVSLHQAVEYGSLPVAQLLLKFLYNGRLAIRTIVTLSRIFLQIKELNPGIFVAVDDQLVVT